MAGVGAQDAILTFSVEPASIDVAPGGTAAGRLTVRNASPYEADDVEVSWAGSSDLQLDPIPAAVPAIGAYASDAVPFRLAVSASAELGESSGTLEAIYSYCIDEVCFQIVESIPVRVRIANASETPSASIGPVPGAKTAARSSPAAWIVCGVALGVVVVCGIGRRRVRWAVVPLLLAAGAALGLGVALAQHKQAQAVGAVLCTSCVGIETVETRTPQLSAVQAAAIDRLTRPVDLLVFYAPWCRSCPYAEGLVELAAERNAAIRYRFVNAEVERDAAARYGVTRAGRTVVPAIVRVDSGHAVFGAENLGDRLVALLQEGT